MIWLASTKLPYKNAKPNDEDKTCTIFLDLQSKKKYLENFVVLIVSANANQPHVYGLKGEDCSIW